VNKHKMKATWYAVEMGWIVEKDGFKFIGSMDINISSIPETMNH